MSTEATMALLTCIVDATTLVNRIHEIKQWVYSESIHLHIPICTFEKVEQIYKASLQPKEVSKEPVSKKPLFVKATRKEIQLFDINPRTTMEFLERARAAANNHRVTFQLPQEHFTQWKEEEEKAIKAAQQPPGPPATFAQAVLLSKLNFTPDSSDSKAPAKSKLVARSSSPKSPWKYHKVPSIPTTGVPQHLRPLMSCVLWRVHEFETNPLMPDTFVLLSDDVETIALALKLNVTYKRTSDIRALVKKKQTDADHRESTGALEMEFPAKAPVHEEVQNGDIPAIEQSTVLSDAFDISVEAVLEPDEDIEELKNSISAEAERNISSPAETPSLQVQAPTPALISEEFAASTKLNIEHIETVTALNSAIDDLTMLSGISTSSTEISDVLPELSDLGHIIEIPPELTREPEKEAVTKVPSAAVEKKEPLTSTEDDSDEEVVVFKPRSRRTSRLPKSSGEASRPTTANGPRSTTATTSRPTTANGTTKSAEVDQSYSLPLPYAGSQLKPQSPVFVPRTLHSAGKHTPTLSTEVVTETSEVSAVNTSAQAQPVAQSPRRGPLPNPHTRRIEGLAQRQSRDIIERQREAIQRQALLATKPPVREIQMQPTLSPTVIDPDAFDRSYVVKPTPSPPNGTTGHQRGHHHHNSPTHSGVNSHFRGHHRRASPAAIGTENSYRGNDQRLSPSRNGSNGNNRGHNRRGSPPSRGTETAEPEVDFVLKSGTPRAATRGRGKLWVP